MEISLFLSELNSTLMLTVAIKDNNEFRNSQNTLFILIIKHLIMKLYIQILLLVSAISMISYTSFGQLKVDQYGRIGMGTNYPNPEFRCHIKGNLLLTNYPEKPGTELRMKVGPAGATIGSNRDIVSFWAEWVNYNRIYSAGHYTISDSTLKSNIKPIKNGISSVMSLTPYSYSLQNRYFDESGKQMESTVNKFGFMSQQVERLFPEVDITNDHEGIKLMEYDQIIPLLVASTQEQQLMIQSLEEEVQELTEALERLNANQSSNPIETKATLYQNRPNPFTENTKIKYIINSENFRSGALLIFDLNGLLLKTLDVSPGENEISIDGGELQPGMYIYSLIVNEKEVNSKKMILME